MGTFGLRPSDCSSPSEVDNESNQPDVQNLLVEKDNQITQLLNRIQQLEIEKNKTGDARYFSSDNDPATSLAAATNQALTSLNQTNQLQISPAGHSESSLSRLHQSGVDFENNHGNSVANPSTIRTSSTRTSLIATISRPSLSGTNHASIEYRSETTLTSWSCVTRSEMIPEKYGEESNSRFPLIEEVEETGQGDSTSDDDEDYEPAVQSFGSRRGEPANDHYAMGYRGVSCVVGGNTVKTFDDEASGSGKLKLLATMPGLSTPDGKRSLVPSKVMLHRQDSNLIMQDKYSRDLLYSFDMEYGKVVDEWHIGPEQLVDFCPGKKFNQMLAEPTFVGASSNSLYIIDPRLHGYKGVALKTYSPSTRTNFSCVATTEYGWVAVGSKNGDIRLYDSLGKNAKTHLRGCKGPVLALDVSKDGAYLVATYEAHLVLYDCHMGFNRSIASSANASGIRVNLTREHAKYLHDEGVPLVYKSATFNLGPNTTEKYITAYVGPYLIAFNLRSILANKPEYEIKRYQDNVVASSFRWNNDKDIVVTVPSDVFVQDRAKLSRPRRHSLDHYRSRNIIRVIF
ncbi:hypothetical protein PtB15_4B151 [Puccinia triticina]|nr:hypothetical protein PtB15_4B151 [Puccinia triticina]